MNDETSKPKISMSRSFKIMLIFSFVNGIGVGFIIPIMALFYVDKFGIDALQIGFILSLSGFIGLFASWIAGRLSDRLGRKPLIVSGSLFSSFFGFILPLTGDVNQATGVLSCRSLGFNVRMPALFALRADLAPPEVRGKYFGMWMTAFTTGDIIAPILSTYLYDLYRQRTFMLGAFTLPGYGIPFFVQSILSAAATIMIMLLVKEPKQKIEQASI
jgi:MFS family permease